MSYSRRAKRMERHHKRAGRSTGINLVSLMDIFTILVFFLLVNSSDGEVLPTQKSVKLPESVAEQQPRMALVIMVNDTDILIHGKVITSVAALLDADSGAADRLKATLQSALGESTLPDTNVKAVRHEATIMGDRDIPYKILKQVMASCTEAGIAHISLAVLQKPLPAS
ncbi:MAG: biopolymer transporter ExbD [Gammaproteobacteria bacterium]|nr:biopolymer transporter ExbD [Gammaproteobacteria bacterium]